MQVPNGYILKAIMVWIVLIIGTQTGSSQHWYENADTLSKQRLYFVTGGQGLTYASTLGGLQFAWYQQYQNGSFHFFNDWPGWMQMDKVGHSVTAYQITNYLYKINRWTGASEYTSMWWATGMGFSYQLAVEVMDGFSEGWGFSNYDLLFNGLGSAAFLTQQLGWHEQRVKLKFSFSPSGLTDLPDPEGRRARNLFGESIVEQWLKDYNGQTYWVSANLWSLAGKPSRFPKWLNVAVGYSVDNVLGAESNVWMFEDDPEIYASNLPRSRQFVFSLDIDLDHVRMPPYLAWSKHVFGFIKFPLPAIVWNSTQGWKYDSLYF